MELTFYLFNEQVADFDDAIVSQKLEGEDSFIEVEVSEDLPFEARAFLQKNRESPPYWLNYVSPYIDFGDDVPGNVSNSLVILVKAKQRILALTMGYGHTAIDKKRLEHNFGLKVALNVVNPESISQVNSTNLDVKTKQTREHISKDSRLYEFGFDIDSDLLRLIAGVPSDATLAKRIKGADSVRIPVDIPLGEIGNKCEELIEVFKRKDYQKNFGFIDYLAPIEDGDLVAELDNLALDQLLGEGEANISLAFPDSTLAEDPARYQLKYRKSNHRTVDIDLIEIRRFLKPLPRPDVFAEISIYGLDEDGKKSTKKYDLADFCICQVEHEGRTYLLSLGQWFEISPDYISRMDTDLQRIEELPQDFLPPMNFGEAERDYCIRVAEASSDLVKMDRNNFVYTGHSRVEVCDLLSREAEFICVKKYYSSSTLSHLFAQGHISSDLLAGMPRYRDFVLVEGRDFAETPPFDRDGIPNRKEVTFIYAIATREEMLLTERLPFFSKINLRHYSKLITKAGFSLKISRIAIEQQ